MKGGLRLTLTLMPESYAICRLGPREAIPSWASGGSFFSVTRTADELSVICPENDVPTGVKQAGGWRLLKFEGPFDFSATGILSSVADPLAGAGVSIVAVSTYETDYILVRRTDVDRAAETLAAAGHAVRR